MADLRIVDAPAKPTEDITGEEKLPTGGSGNYSVTLDSVADFTAVKKDLADNSSVNSKVNGVRQELDAHIEDLINPHQVTKGQIGLGNVDNTADADKPVSNSTQSAIISAVAPKADKIYVDNQLILKADKSDVYTKQESSDLVNNSISTALTPVNASLELAKRGIANRYDPLLTYNSGQRVVLTNGDIVKSTIDGNVNNPNVDMTGWVNPEYEQNLVNQLNYDKNLNLIDFFTESEKSQYEADPLTFDIKRPLQEAVDSTKNLSTKISFPPRYFNLKSPVLIAQDNIEIDLGGASLEYTGASLTAAIQVKGTAGSDMNVLSDIDQYATSFTMSTEDAMTLSAGDYVKISTSENYFVITGRDYKKGEIVQVESISGGVVSIAGNGFQLAYSASSGIKAKKLNLIDKFNLTGGKLYGTGTNNRQTLILAEYARKVCINGVDASASEVGVIFRSVVGGTVVLSDMHDINRSGSGYAISAEGASQHIIVMQNNFKNNRHSFTTGGYDGVCMNILVQSNIADDHNAGAVFNTHGNARFTDFKHNIITDALIGISCYSPCNNVIGNTMSNIKQSAVYQTEAGSINSKVNNNTIDRCSVDSFDAITFVSSVTQCEVNRYVECNGNTITNCPNGKGIGANFTVSATFPEVITTNDNSICNYGYEAIFLRGGLVTTVDGNTIFRGARSSLYAINIENRTDTTGYPYGNTVNTNNNNIGQAGRGIFVKNAAMLMHSGNNVRTSASFKLTLESVTELRGDVLRSPDNSLYRLNVANGGAISTVVY